MNKRKARPTAEQYRKASSCAPDATENINDEVWIVHLSRYHRDNLVRLLNAVGWPFYLPGQYPKVSPLIDPALSYWNSGDWVGEIALKLARLDGSSSIDAGDNPNVIDPPQPKEAS
jgi:hypothetical protein